jgi:hypothetical protein
MYLLNIFYLTLFWLILYIIYNNFCLFMYLLNIFYLILKIIYFIYSLYYYLFWLILQRKRMF